MAEQFSANLRMIRRERKLEQAELSDRLTELGHPIGTNSISRLERAERRADVDDVVALAAALGVEVERLLGGGASDQESSHSAVEVDSAVTRIGKNLRAARGRMGQRELADRVTELGVPMRFNTVSRIEQSRRGMDVTELLALAVALDVSPSRLLLCATAADEPLRLTPTYVTTARDAWWWWTGDRPAGRPSPSS